MSSSDRERRSRHPGVKLFGALGVAVTLVMIVAAPVSAHAVLLSESPRSSSTSRTAPAELQLTFSENVEVSFGSIALFNEKGATASTSLPRIKSAIRPTPSPPGFRSSK